MTRRLWLAPVPAGYRAPAAPPLRLPPGLDDDRLPEPVDDGDPLVPLPEDLASDIVYDRLPLPPRPGPLLRAGAVERLRRADAALPAGLRIVVLDGWRPPSFQRALLEYYRARHPGLREGYVADPDAARLAPHTTGGAVDLTLALDGVPLALGSDYDEFAPEAALTAIEDRHGPERDLRRVLAAALSGAGFVPYPDEWWHWSYGEQWWAAANGLERTRYSTVEEPAGSRAY